MSRALVRTWRVPSFAISRTASGQGLQHRRIVAIQHHVYNPLLFAQPARFSTKKYAKSEHTAIAKYGNRIDSEEEATRTAISEGTQTKGK